MATAETEAPASSESRRQQLLPRAYGRARLPSTLQAHVGGTPQPFRGDLASRPASGSAFEPVQQSLSVPRGRFSRRRGNRMRIVRNQERRCPQPESHPCESSSPPGSQPCAGPLPRSSHPSRDIRQHKGKGRGRNPRRTRPHRTPSGISHDRGRGEERGTGADAVRARPAGHRSRGTGEERLGADLVRVRRRGTRARLPRRPRDPGSRRRSAKEDGRARTGHGMQPRRAFATPRGDWQSERE